MSKVCQVTGKRPITGNNVSHSHRKTRRRFLPNLHYHRFWVESEQRFVRLRVSAAGMRIIDKKGIDTVLADLREIEFDDPLLVLNAYVASGRTLRDFTAGAVVMTDERPHLGRGMYL